MMFRARGKDTSRVMTIDDMLSYRDAYTQPLPEFNFDNLMIEAMRANQPAPPPTLVTSENAFRHIDVKTLSDEAQYRRKIQVLLNKLTESNVDILTSEILVPEVLLEDNVSIVVELIFDKALDEPFFLSTYIKLITALAGYETAQDPAASASTPTSPTSPTVATPTVVDNSKSRVRRSLINKSQQTFEEQLGKNTEGMSEEEVDRRRRQEIANVHFVAELLNVGLLGWRVFNSVVQHLFADPPVDLHVELGLKLVNSCGKKIDEGGPEIKATKKYHPADCFKYIEKVAETNDKPPAGISLRVWFAAKNLVALRANKWAAKVAKEVVAPPPPPPAPKAAAAPVKNDEALKRAKEAQPPEWLSEAMRKDAVRIATKDIKPKDDDGESPTINYDAIIAELGVLNSDVLPPICRRAVAFPIIKHFCTSSKEMVREALIPLFKKYGANELQHATSWVIADAIMNRELEDAPKFFDRLATLLAVCAPNALVDVFPRASVFLDSLEKEDDELPEWQHDFIKAITVYITEAKAKGGLAPCDKVLDTFARQMNGFFQPISVDVVLGFAEAEDLGKWVNNALKGNNEKARQLADELSMFC